jgi:broad specificity phosphatase PhoE
VLVRHGPSAHQPAGWMNLAQFNLWRQAYEKAGIRNDATAPRALRELMAHADLLLCSETPRALESAQRLSRGHQIVVAAALGELELPCPPLRWLRMPLPAWMVSIAVAVVARRIKGEHPTESETERLRKVSEWLQTLSLQHSLMVVVTHGAIRRELASRLNAAGWRLEAGWRSQKPWSAWVLTAAER